MAILNKIFSAGATKLVEAVGNVVDELHTSQEEKDKLKLELEQMIRDYDIEIQKEVTSRWNADMSSDNWLSKSIRPLTLAFLLVVLTLFTLIDFGYIDYQISDSWIDLWSILSITAFGAYFGSRGLEKIKRNS
jgi:hypothetical protein